MKSFHVSATLGLNVYFNICSPMKNIFRRNRLRTILLFTAFISILGFLFQNKALINNNNKIVTSFETVLNRSAPGTSMTTFIFENYRVPSVNCLALFNEAVTVGIVPNGTNKTMVQLEAVSKGVERLLEVLNIDKIRLLDSARQSDPKRREYCDSFIKERGYVMDSLSSEEEEFPVAYSIQIYKDVEMFERLLRAIYRPQNYYCVHIDLSSNKSIHDVAHAIVDCFPNVFIPSRLVDVVHEKYTVLEADLICMEELLKRFKKWKYYINLTGQEFPLRTNLEIVRILKVFNGTNNMQATKKRILLGRFFMALPIPIEINIIKGEVHIIGSRAFVDYAINNETAIKFRNWVAKTNVADETFFASLNHNPQLSVPGAYKGEPESFENNYVYVARHKCWIWEREWHPNCSCASFYWNFICIIGVGDLPRLATRKELFVNKFHADFEPAAYACLEELLYNRTRDELTGLVKFNASEYYGQLSFVNNHV